MTTPLTSQQGALFPSHPPTAPIVLSTAWMLLDSFIREWAAFGAQATEAPALTATGVAFLALSWETSALHHRTLAHRDRQRGRSRSAMRNLGQSLQDLGHATRHWSQAALWLERQALDERSPAEDLEPVRVLMRQVLWQQQRIWTLIQEVQKDLLAYGQYDAEGPGHRRERSPSGDREEGTR